MTVNRGPNEDACRLACTTRYRAMLAWHQANHALLIAGDPTAQLPPLVVLGLDPATLVARALNAELLDPAPDTGRPFTS